MQPPHSFYSIGVYQHSVGLCTPPYSRMLSVEELGVRCAPVSGSDGRAVRTCSALSPLGRPLFRGVMGICSPSFSMCWLTFAFKFCSECVSRCQTGVVHANLCVLHHCTAPPRLGGRGASPCTAGRHCSLQAPLSAR